MENLGNIITYHSKNSPEKWAIKFDGDQYSFLELENLANNFAHLLKEKHNVSKGDRVIIISKKSCELIAAIIAIWKLGAIYVPADHNNGLNRLKYIIDDIKPCLVISSDKYLDEFKAAIGTIPTISYNEIESVPKDQGKTFERQIDGNDVASIFYTSGSTGRPKGVCLNHQSMLYYFQAENELLKIDDESALINFGPFHFDVTVQDTFIPLYYGASVYIHDGLLIPEIIADIINKNNITHLICVSSVLSMITPAADDFDLLQFSNLQACMTGGEVCNPSLINLWLEKIPGFRIYNGYGPTECNSLCMAYHIKMPDTNRKGPYPFGTCFTGSLALLIDSDRNVINGENVVGTLIIGGKQLMNYYWNLPEETKNAFISIDGEQYYITGDLAYRDENGDYVFEGRMDKEVKILGRRINLNEIRNSLLKAPDVEYAFVDVFETNNRKKIYAYVYGPNLKSNTDEEQINVFLRNELPVYMIPEKTIIGKNIPKTSTNKVFETEIKNLIANQIS